VRAEAFLGPVAASRLPPACCRWRSAQQDLHAGSAASPARPTLTCVPRRHRAPPRRSWASAPVSRANIADNLARIADRRWVASECLRRLAPDAEAQRLLINYGLAETDRHAGPRAAAARATAAAARAAAAAAARAAAGDAAVAEAARPAAGAEEGEEGGRWTPARIGRDGPEARWWRWRRLELWQHSDRLGTFQVGGRAGGRGGMPQSRFDR
jgi:hypothetical protein